MVTVARNSYFPEFDEGSLSEQNLYQSLVDETIEIAGQSIKYFASEITGIDVVLNEVSSMTFSKAYTLPAITPNIEDFDQSANLLSKFGVNFSDKAVFIVSKTHFTETVGIDSIPKVSDLIFHPLSKILFKVDNILFRNKYQQFSKVSVFELEVSVYRENKDTFKTNEPEIDIDLESLENIFINHEKRPIAQTIVVPTKNPFGGNTL